MAARPDPSASAAQFEAYFVRADLDKDGKISGPEAVPFLQGSGLPKAVLAKIWMYADQRRAGFLGREEFYNALKLVTVAQTGRELTPEIVQAAFKTPTIPPPKINIPANPTTQTNYASTPNHFTNLGGTGSGRPQSSGFMGQQPLGVNQPVFPTGNNFMGPPQVAPATAATSSQVQQVGPVNQPVFPTGKNFMGPPQVPLATAATSPQVQQVGPVPPSVGGMVAPRPNSNVPNLTTDWFTNKAAGALVPGTPQRPISNITSSVNQDASGSTFGLNPRPQIAATPDSLALQVRDAKVSSVQQDSRALVVAGNGPSSNTSFGGDMFSASSKQKPDVSASTISASSLTNSSRAISAVPVPQNTGTVGQVGTLQSTSLIPSAANLMQQTQSLVKPNQMDVSKITSALPVSSIQVGNVAQATSQSQLPWPKFSKDDIEKYTGIFMKVDKDRDGKITGLEARNLFLSWGLPREVLKQVWDLSDQDNDSMLSIMEFCVALYLMQRFREGRPLPTVLPESIRSDQTLLIATTQQVNGYSGPVLQPNNGQTATGPQPAAPVTSAKPPLHPPVSRPDESAQPAEQKSKVPVLEKHLVDQLSTEEQSALNAKFKEASDAEKKVQELEKEILESRQKIEFYRAKMQELVLYKSRCDNRLNEIMERTSADKREVDILAKKYEEKYKKSGDVASRLSIEEATFRDIQERKLELYNAIVKMEQGGSADGLQGRADKIQTDLEDLVKVLSERCKEYGLRAKPTSLVELPFGWQPGIQEGAALWDEDWDNFEDDGFSVIKELTVEVENIVIAKSKPSTVEIEKVEMTEKTVEDKVENKVSAVNKDKDDQTAANPQQIGENGSAHAEHEDNPAKSPPESPSKNVVENTDEDAHPVVHDVSPHAQTNNRDQGGAESPVFRGNFASERSWGPTFDHSDDTDSVWSYNPKDNEHESQRQNYSFGSEDFGLFPPIEVGSPGAASAVGKEKGPFFDSVPSTPLFSSGFSPKFNSGFSPKFNSGFSPKFNSGFSPKSEGPEDHSFDRFDHHDFFGTHDDGHDSGPFPQHESLGRFDSFRSTSDFGKGETFASFDSFRNPTDYGRNDSLARFDSFRSTTTDYNKGSSLFDESDFFGSKPFKSSEGHSPTNGTSNWNAF